MVSLLYLKYAFNESDEGVVERWSETPTWQYFSGMDYFEHRLPCNASLISRFRSTIGEEGVEEILAKTIEVAQSLKLISKKTLETVVVDSTVQPKAVAHPTDSRLLDTARKKLVELAKAAGIALKQTFAKEGKQLTRQAGGYAHARQFRRVKKPLKRLRTIVGRLVREIERKLPSVMSPLMATVLEGAIRKANQIVHQSRHPKSKNKLYSWHAPEVECISKGKARNSYEFGVKVGIASTLTGNLIVGARSFPGNPYDGHTLNEQIEQASILIGAPIKEAFVDLGYRGVDKDNPDLAIKHRGRYKSLSQRDRKRLKRRQSVEPIIGHLKSDHRMDRCHLAGSRGDALHAVLCAAGYNIRWLLRMIRKKGIRLYLSLIRLLKGSGLWEKVQRELKSEPIGSLRPAAMVV